MATRKRTKDAATLVAEATLSDDIVVGSHLTVITHGDGTTTLKWDDEALLRDVRLAILTAESKIPASVESKPKTKRTKK
jgi:hypothetical protein